MQNPTSQLQAKRLVALLGLCLVLLALLEPALAGGKGKGKGGSDDIIMYRGNIVLRGDKEGGSIVMADNHPTSEEVEFAPSFFGAASDDLSGLMGRRRRRRR